MLDLALYKRATANSNWFQVKDSQQAGSLGHPTIHAQGINEKSEN